MGVGMLMVRHEATSASLVRREIAADLASQRVAHDSVADVVLVASELVGNAIVHAVPAGDLDITWDVIWDVRDGAVVIRVTDPSADQPRPRAAGADATSGRGLTIVAAIAVEWGVDRMPVGKQVWARIPVARAG